MTLRSAQYLVGQLAWLAIAIDPRLAEQLYNHATHRWSASKLARPAKAWPHVAKEIAMLVSRCHRCQSAEKALSPG